ncbi:MAG: trypsin-like peptidase domain-containing protein [Firmicutes bacterium]|nr:trypsin-like peptidase domain-containing protein [Bacillota bacterium]
MKEYFKMILAGIIGALIAIVLYTGIISITDRYKVTDNSTVTQVDEVLVGENVSIPKIVEKTSPSVVQISRSAGINSSTLGSGVIIDATLGYVVTNYHVTGSSGDLTVTLLDGRVIKATRVGSDQDLDISIIKLADTSDLTSIELGDSGILKTGQLAIAIGSPLSADLANSVTVGVISAVSREITYTAPSGNDIVINVIQTDAAINPGNSGGALINSLGQLIGINSIKVSQTGIEGLGFAIPINDAKPIIEEIIKTGTVSNPYLGVSNLTNITQEMSDYYKLPIGILVGEVAPNSNASNAGVIVNDIITYINQTKVENTAQLRAAINKLNPGDDLRIKVYRDKSYITLYVVLK